VGGKYKKGGKSGAKGGKRKELEGRKEIVLFLVFVFGYKEIL